MTRKLDRATWFIRCLERKADNIVYDISLWPKNVIRDTKVAFICTIHGMFYQRPSDHIKGSSCPKCGSLKAGLSNSKSKYYYLEKFREIHGNTYSYLVDEWPETINNKTKLIAKCRKHGEFSLTPNNHISISAGCPSCGLESRAAKRTHLPEDWLIKFKEIHGNTYDYTSIDWGSVVNMTTKVTVSCREHGSFIISLNQHQRGHGCPACSGRIFKFFYVNQVDGTCLKFGITSNLQARLQRQNMLNKVKMTPLIVWEFENTTKPIELENVIKSKVKPVLCKSDMAVGHSETCKFEHLDMIVKLIESNGGVRVSE